MITAQCLEQGVEELPGTHQQRKNSKSGWDCRQFLHSFAAGAGRPSCQRRGDGEGNARKIIIGQDMGQRQPGKCCRKRGASDLGDLVDTRCSLPPTPRDEAGRQHQQRRCYAPSEVGEIGLGDREGGHKRNGLRHQRQHCPIGAASTILKRTRMGRDRK